MKVCTDACLFGALVAGCSTCLPWGRFPAITGEGRITHCLDIGTGTGLLSLMIAQKNNNIHIDAVEIDEQAAAQAKENIAASPWAANITVFKEDILKFDAGPQDAVHKKYDCIVSNPPFFEDDLQSADNARNKAKHNTSLSLAQLLQVIEKLLNPKGFFAVLLPYHRVDYFIAEARKFGLYLSKKILVKQTFKHKFFRGILFFNRTEAEPQLMEIIIRDAENNYTPEFAAALKDYYLFL
ncbi:MAG: methyltransferase [Ferruginibacter sp.]|nr:methyltransferase [Ferruginibacter sp.]